MFTPVVATLGASVGSSSGSCGGGGGSAVPQESTLALARQLEGLADGGSAADTAEGGREVVLEVRGRKVTVKFP